MFIPQALFKDNLFIGPLYFSRERERQTDRQTDRQAVKPTQCSRLKNYTALKK